MCCIALHKLHAHGILSKIRKYLKIHTAKLLGNAFYKQAIQLHLIWCLLENTVSQNGKDSSLISKSSLAIR